MNNTITCSIAQCSNRRDSLGLCQKHYTRLRKHGSPHITLYNRDNNGKCSIKDCNRSYHCKGYCTVHYWRLTHNGDPHKVVNVMGENRRSNHLYGTYMAMKTRCYKDTDAHYKHWGGRGIKVCDRWLGQDGFSNFIADMGDRPTDKHSIDRINNDGDYEPSNCRWATAKQQANNQRPRRKALPSNPIY